MAMEGGTESTRWQFICSGGRPSKGESENWRLAEGKAVSKGGQSVGVSGGRKIPTDFYKGEETKF